MKNVTIAEVAAAAGVARSTVSRVLNGGYASDEVETRVRQAIERLDYSPSATARNLKTGRTGIMGLVAATSQAPWFSLFLGGLEAALARHGASVALCSLELSNALGDDALGGNARAGGARGGPVYSDAAARRWVEDRRVDSLLMVRPTKREAELVTLAEQAAMPQLHVVPDWHYEGVPVLSADNATAGRQAGNHLAELGHRDAVFFGATKSSVDSNDRARGLEASLAAHPRSRLRVIHGTDYGVDSGVRAAHTFLKESDLWSSTAAVLASDAMALGFMRTLQACSNLRIPQDLSLVGFDDVPTSRLVWPGLTTVAQPVALMGERAGDLLLTDSEPQAELFETRLVCRESTARPRSHPLSPRVFFTL